MASHAAGQPQNWDQKNFLVADKACLRLPECLIQLGRSQRFSKISDVKAQIPNAGKYNPKAETLISFAK
jgi:hypothetical protein